MSLFARIIGLVIGVFISPHLWICYLTYGSGLAPEWLYALVVLGVFIRAIIEVVKGLQDGDKPRGLRAYTANIW